MNMFRAPKNGQNSFLLEPLEPRLLLNGSVGLPDDILIPAAAEAAGAPGVPLWVPQGPSPATGGQVEGIIDGPVTGAIHTLAPHPTDVNVLYIGAVNGGVWKTTDATAGSPTWTPLTDEESSLSISALEFDPTDGTHETLVAGIGRYSAFSPHDSALEGILRTTDGGATWVELDGGGTLDGENVSGVAPRGAVIVVSVSTPGAGAYIELHRSDNTGASFTPISGVAGTGLPLGDVTDLVGDPGDPARLYAAVVDAMGKGIYTSTDTGATWSDVTAPAMAAVIDGATNNIEIAVHDSPGNNAVYAGIMNDGQLAGMFRSGDQGATWAAMDIPETDEGGAPRGIFLYPEPEWQGQRYFSIVADPTDPDVVYVGGDGQPIGAGDAWPNSIGANDYTGRLFRGDASEAPGSQWTALTHIPSTTPYSAPHAGSRGMVFDAAGDIIEGDDGGIYKRTDPELNNGDWVSLNGNLMVAEVHSAAWDANTDTIIVGTQNIGTGEQVDTDDVVWRTVSTDSGGKVAVDDSDPTESIRYSSYQRLEGFRRVTYDLSNTETSRTDVGRVVAGSAGNTVSHPFDPTVQDRQHYELNAIDPARMILGTNFLYESFDRGDNFTALGGLDDLNADVIDNDLDGETDEGDEFAPTNSVGAPVHATAYGGVSSLGLPNADVLWVGNVNGDVLLRTTGVGMPTATVTPFPGGAVRDIAIDPEDWGTAYVITDDEVYVTGDAGLAWTNITGTLSDTKLKTVELIPTGVADGIIVGGLTGVHASLAELPGEWLELGSDLPNAHVYDLDYDESDNVLVAGTLGRGVWTIPDVRETMLDELLGSIEGRVWEDINGDGIHGPSEADMSGETVDLYDSLSVLVDTTTTDVSGEYAFEDLIPGDYYVEFHKPFEFAITPKDQGGDETLDSNANRPGGRTDAISISFGENVTDIDAGMFGPDRFEQNDTYAAAARLGVLSALHIENLTISVPDESDWFEVELLSNEAAGLDIGISFTHAFGDLNLAVFESDGFTPVGESNSADDNELVSTGPLTAGTYYVRVTGVGAAVNVYNISTGLGVGSITRIFYVNDDSLVDGFYTLAVGDDLNDGLTPFTPKETVQSVLADYVLGPTDLVAIDTGVYAGGTITITVDDEGADYAGAPAGSSFEYNSTRFELIDSDYNLFYGLVMGGANGGTGFYAHGNAVNDSTNNEFRFNTFTGTSVGIRIDNGEADLIHYNTISGGGTDGVQINGGLSVIIRDNTISGRNDAIEVRSDDATIEVNTLWGDYRGIRINSGTVLANISRNDIRGDDTGISASGATTNIFKNTIHNSDIGVWSNTLGTNVYGNDIHDNTTGISGYGTFGGTDWGYDQVNEIHDNTTGIFADNGSTVRFNRVSLSTVGIHIDDGADVHHNVVFRNTGQGILVDNGNGVTIVNNTVYAPFGDAVHLRNSSRDVELRNNILWVDSGYDINVATDSQVGFASDYNNLYSTGAGNPVWWQKDFSDLFDWQVEADFDTHSIGRTVLHPLLDDPQFVDAGADNYRLTNFTSTSIDAGRPLDIYPLEPAPSGSRINLGAYGNTAQAARADSPYIALDSPKYYTDVIVDEPNTILWHTFDDLEPGKELAGDVNIELWREGTGWIADVATRSADVGWTDWLPSDHVSSSVTNRYRIRVISAVDPGIWTESREPFSIVSQGGLFYVDDDSDVGDEYTPGFTGDNRNTGKTPVDPKANLLPILRSYTLTPPPDCEVRIDTGIYDHVRNVVLSAAGGVGDDEGMIITGPTDPAKIATINRGNTHPGSTNIELNNADWVTLKNLTLTNAEMGVWVHNSSTHFTGERLTVAGNAKDGLYVSSDAEYSNLDEIDAYDNGRYGIYVATPISSLSDSEVHDNASYGIYMTAQNGVVLEGNEVYNNTVGIYLHNPGVVQGVIGNTDLSLGRGNMVYNNSTTGIEGTSNALAAGNTVYGHNGTNDKGIYVHNGAEARNNVVYDSHYGIYCSYGSSAIGNRVYLSSRAGIRLTHTGEVRLNTLYDNSIGVWVGGWYDDVISNNLIYGTSGQGIVLTGSQRPDILSNTIYLESGEAVRIENGAADVKLRDNILWVDDGYDLFVDSTSQVGFDSDFNILRTTGAGQVGNWQGVDRPTLAAWRSAVFTDANSFYHDPLFVDPDGGDGVLGYNDPVNDGRDDNFHLISTEGWFTGSLAPVRNAGTGLPVWQVYTVVLGAARSPAIDRGDDASDFSNEPTHNGGYINIGAYGNTALASKSPPEYVLVTLPDGGEVWPADQTFPIRWRTEPISAVDQAAGYRTEILADVPIAYWRLGEGVGPTAVDETGGHNGTYENEVLLGQAGIFPGDDAASFDGVNDVVVVPDNVALKPLQITVEAWINPAVDNPAWGTILTKTTDSSWTDGYGLAHISGGEIRFFINDYDGADHYASTTVSPDVWTHVVGTYDGIDINIYADGILVDSSPYVDPITHSPADVHVGSDVTPGSFTWKGELDEVALYDRALALDEVLDHYHYRTDTRRVDIELLRGGALDSLLRDDYLNSGEFPWPIPAATVPGTDFEVRITRSDDPLLTDTSNAEFEITEPISLYYVNDFVSDASDEYTTAVGNDINDGLTPGTPKASIRGILDAYGLDAGDTILVDTGTYTLGTNIPITSDDAGAEIRGPVIAGHRAVIDRANTAAGSYAFELIDADGVILDHLAITGAHTGVYASNGSDSDNVTISNSEIFDNTQYGVRLYPTNDEAVLTGNEVYGNSYGVYLEGEAATVTGNTIHDNVNTGLHVTGYGAEVSGNTVYGNATGIYTYGYGDDTTVIGGNTVFDNRSYGIYAGNNTLAVGNEVYGHVTAGNSGIYVHSDAEARGNTVHHNLMGIMVNYGGIAEDNRVFGNTTIGIWTNYASPVRGNQVYDNSVGIQANSQFSSEISNNIVYENTEQGILLYGVNSARVANNTVYQQLGDAVHVQTGSTNVDIRNSILHVTSGYDISVDSTSQVGFSSDYNLLQYSGAGTLAWWDGFIFNDRADWFYELGFDGNSRTAAPLLVDMDGADDILGFSTTPLGGATIIDDGDPGYVLSGTWTYVSGDDGYNDDYDQNTVGDGLATWAFGGLTPGATYHVASTWRNKGGNTNKARYEVYDDGELVSMVQRNQYLAPDDFPEGGVQWETQGYFVATDTTIEVRLTNDAANRLIADAVRLQEVEGDGGVDDDFHLQATSPGIDTGDLLSYYLTEPAPNGDRINLGAYGNTAEATTSPTQLVQVLNPNGLEKFELGQAVDINWRSAGLTTNRTVALINSGNQGTVDNWLYDRYYTTWYSQSSFVDGVDASAIDSAPEALYQSYRYSYPSVGETLAYSLPVPDGEYTIRLHFAEPHAYIDAGERVFDIYLQGAPALDGDNYDIRDEAGDHHKAVTWSSLVTAEADNGILLELINETSNPALISGIEVTAVNPFGVASPTVDLELSTTDGPPYTPIADASGLAMDRFGRGSHPWTAAPVTGSNLARIKVLANDGATPEDVSDEAFLIANDGDEYFVNIAGDANPLDNDYTTAPGDNLNSGKTLDAPMASLRALLGAYDLDADDTIYVDTGVYLLPANILMTAQDAEVIVLGPTGPGRSAVLDRANTAAGSYVFELLDADGITLDHLAITGGLHGVYASSASDSDDVTIRNSDVYDNSSSGIYVDSYNDNVQVSDNLIRRNTTYGIRVSGYGANVSGNTVYGSNSYGIYAAGNGDLTTVDGNTVFDNRAYGIYAGRNVLVTGNEVYNHDGSGHVGIHVSSGAKARGNVAHHNYNGIYAGDGGSSAVGNRVYANTNAGIALDFGADAEDNIAYDNSIGIKGFSYASGLIRNNLLYGNGNQGIVLNASNGADIINNTVYQPVGDAVRIENNTYGTDVRNNILWVQDGYDIFVDSSSQTDFTSDYNILHTTLSGKMVSWGGVEFTERQYWFYEFGHDRNSLTVDPQFFDIDGADGIVGFSTETLAAAQVIDDGDPSFVLDGTWTPGPGGVGYDGDYQSAPGDSGDNTAAWTFTGLTAGATYQVAATWLAGANTRYAPYEIYDGADIAWAPEIDQRYAPDDFQDAALDWWEELGVVTLTGTTLTVRLTDRPAGRVMADAIRIQQIEGDRGADDNFHPVGGSPGVDLGDPLEYYFEEPGPNGGRVNAGAYGNTPQATSSDDQTVQVLDPNGYEKLEVGDTFNIEWRSSGLTQDHTVALINSGNGPTVDNWLYDRYYTTWHSYSAFVDAVDTGVTDSAPEALYQSYRYSYPSVGGELAYSLPVPDGEYTIRLHFAEPSTYVGVGARMFDIYLQGALALDGDNYDIRDEAGDHHTAVIWSSLVTAEAGEGILLELINETSNPALISGIELTAFNPIGVASPTVNLELTTTGGGPYAPIAGASGLTMDRFGRGSHPWTAGPETPTNMARIKVVANDGATPEDESDAPFLIANDGPDYFVNVTGDLDLKDNVYTSAPGDNANSGKTRGDPMAGINAVLLAYDLDPGDTIFVDTGDYTLLNNIVLNAQDSGVTILGPVHPVHEATQDRNNTASGSYAFELIDADGVILDSLGITGGQTGVYALNGSDSDDVEIRNCEIYSNTYQGVYIGSSNDRATLDNNILRNNGDHGAQVGGADATFTGNHAYDNSQWGLYVTGPGSTLTGNEVRNNQYGINASSTGDQTTVNGNAVFDNTTIGIQAYHNVLVSGNHVYGNGTGIKLYYAGSRALQNFVYLNYDGINVGEYSVAEANRVYQNANYGIVVDWGSSVIRNRIYSNSVGVRGGAYFSGDITNNLIYDNSDQGVILYASNAPRVVNNTIYQLVGDAVSLENSTYGARIYNNILWVEAGYDIFVQPSAQTGLDSDYNVLYSGPGIDAHVGYWNGTTEDALADWQAASAQDANSIASDPDFVDIDGADNVLGYTTVGGGYDGGGDDNFSLHAASAAIDRAHTWTAPLTDIDGFARVDDPGMPNLGAGDYAESDLGSSLFAAGGTAKNWRNDNYHWTLTFTGGFTFPFYDGSYSSVYVSSNGFLQFDTTSSSNDGTNTLAEFVTHRRIAPMWDDLKTNGAGDDIYVDTSVGDRVTIRWDATNVLDSSDVNVAVTLYDSGEIRFHYGPGNVNLTPTVGLSHGDGVHYVMASYDGAAGLTDANSLGFTMVDGIVDIGAHEFTGSSTDTDPPIVVNTSPTRIHNAEPLMTFDEFDVTFSEPLNFTDATSDTNYDLRSAGPDLAYDTFDDVEYTLLPSYTAGTHLVSIGIVGGDLPGGEYRLTIDGESSIHDLAGNRLDGDDDGSEGPSYVRFFDVDETPPSVMAFEVNESLPQRSQVFSLAITFTENVWPSLAASPEDLSLENITTTETFSLAGMPLAYDPPTDKATWNTAGVAMTDGNYVATLSAAGVSDEVGNPLDGDGNGTGGDDYTFEFFVLAGDVNGDRSVDVLDFAVLIGQWGLRGSGLEGDLNNDGRVDMSDFAVLRGHFGNTLPAPAPSAAPEASTAMVMVMQAAAEPIAETAAPVVPVVSQPLDDNSDANDDSIATTASAAAVDLLVESPSPGSYISGPRSIPVGLRATTPYRAVAAEYDPRTPRDDLMTDGTGDMAGDGLQVSIDMDDSLDLLAESPVAMSL